MVRLSPSTPLSEPAVKTEIGGTTGAVVSMVRINGSEIGETLPAGSVEVVVIEWTPVDRAGEVKLHVPPADTVAVPSRVAPS